MFIEKLLALFIAILPLGVSLAAWGRAQWQDRACLISASEFTKIVSDSLGSAEFRDKATYGIALVNLRTGQFSCESFFSGDRETYPASSIKTLVAISVLEKIDSGERKLSDLITINQPNAKEECSDWGCDQYGPGKQRTISQLLDDMIIVSNNIATNQLIDVATKPELKKTAAALGAPSLILVHKLYSNVNPEPENPGHNSATARGMVAMYEEIASGKRGVLREESRALLEATLGKQKYNNRLNFHFPPELRFYHKTGSTSQSTSDGGYFFLNPNEVMVLVGIQDFANVVPLQKVGKGVLDALRRPPSGYQEP